MRLFNRFALLASVALITLPAAAHAQTAANLATLRGLAPFDQLLTTPAGKAALKANYAVTAAIQSGGAHQPLLLAFPAQQAQALSDAFEGAGNGAQLADGLGSTLGGAYQALATYSSTDDGATSSFTSAAASAAPVFAYTMAVTRTDAGVAKSFFANGTTDGSAMSSPAAFPLLMGGTISVFDQAYPHPQAAGKAACPVKKDPAGDSRPLQTLKTLATFTATDYFGVKHSSLDYLCGPTDDEQKSPSFPSGHTTVAYTAGMLLALLVPQRYSQEVVSAAEYANDRIVLGAHYPMDIIAGRTLTLYDLAHLLANDPAYVGLSFPVKDGAAPVPSIADFPAALAAAKADVQAALAAKTGMDVATAASHDTSRFASPAKDAAFYEATLTYGLPVVYPAQAGKAEDVLTLAPEAGYLLTAAFHGLSLQQADAILTATEAPGGGFLDNGSAFGVYSRLDLYKASLQAQALLANEAKARAAHK
jgi:hypothetical protein